MLTVFTIILYCISSLSAYFKSSRLWQLLSVFLKTQDENIAFFATTICNKALRSVENMYNHSKTLYFCPGLNNSALELHVNTYYCFCLFVFMNVI